MIKIMGVDFSGAKADRNTWVAEGNLEGSLLTLETCCPQKRTKLTKRLADLKVPAVAAMDFPFSVPVEFARFWRGDDVVNHGWGMPDLWAATKGMTLCQFRDLGNQFVGMHGEPKRPCDPPESFSPLHNAVGLDMVPMTFRGMQLLHCLWSGDAANSLVVPPLTNVSRPGAEHRTILLEVMPGAVLHRLGLPFTVYKDKSGASEDAQAERRVRRQKILDQLYQKAAPVRLDLSKEIPRSRKGQMGERGQMSTLHDICLDHADGLDAVVAAIAAALWATDRTLFQLPPEQGQPGYDPIVLLEGWLYAPKGCCQPWWLDKLTGQ